MGEPDAAKRLLVLARRVLLDALEALTDQRDALILVGAQALYIHTESAPVAVPEATKDSDIALDRRVLADDPLLEEAMTRAGFTRDDQPGRWLGAMGVPVDLMSPESMSDPGGRRAARMPPHAQHAVRRAAGLEAALVDNAWAQISALDVADTRTFDMKVAGPGALLISKCHKLGERADLGGNRLNDKDAHDLYRLLATIPTDGLAETLRRLLDDAVSAKATREGLGYFATLFGAGPDSQGCRMAGRAEGLLGDPELAAEAVAALAHDLITALPWP
jgi:hypothetical protein